MRLAGATLAQTAAATGLSHPTIIAACKAFAAGGWSAIKVKPRGRGQGAGRVLGPEQEQHLRTGLQQAPSVGLWHGRKIRDWVQEKFAVALGERTLNRYLERWQWLAEPAFTAFMASPSALHRQWLKQAYPLIERQARQSGARLLWGGLRSLNSGCQLFVHTPRGRQLWLALPHPARATDFIVFFERLLQELDAPVCLILRGCDLHRVAQVRQWLGAHPELTIYHPFANPAALVPQSKGLPGERLALPPVQAIPETTRNSMNLTHLQRLEAESIHIMREVVAEADNPVMLYSIGKDSAVMLHLAMKAFYPSVPPFPLLHVDTRWKFREMYSFRDQMAEQLGMDLLVHINPEAIEKDINPFTHGSAIHTDITKTEGLKQALDKYGFDAAFGGARRDEEKSRAKERIFSFRTAQHRWDPKNQRPELWKLYNARKHKGESIRVFPLSNWTELDIWQYIHLENIPIVPLYYAAERPVVERDGTLIMVDDERMPLKPGEVPMMKKVRFRTLGCYPLTGAVESEADTLPAIIQEMLLTKTSERQGRMIDHDSAASMEKKKQEGYF